MTDNSFYYDTKSGPEDEGQDAEENAAVSKWDERLIFATNPELAVIAVEAIAENWRGRRARIAVLESALLRAYQYIGVNTRDPRLRHSAAWDCYFHYLREKMRL